MSRMNVHRLNNASVIRDIPFVFIFYSLFLIFAAFNKYWIHFVLRINRRNKRSYNIWKGLSSFHLFRIHQSYTTLYTTGNASLALRFRNTLCVNIVNEMCSRSTMIEAASLSCIDTSPLARTVITVIHLLQANWKSSNLSVELVFVWRTHYCSLSAKTAVSLQLLHLLGYIRIVADDLSITKFIASAPVLANGSWTGSRKVWFFIERLLPLP